MGLEASNAALGLSGRRHGDNNTPPGGLSRKSSCALFFFYASVRAWRLPFATHVLRLSNRFAGFRTVP